MEIFTENFKSTPFWWEQSPRPEIKTKKVPKTIDVAIIGSGYTDYAQLLLLRRRGVKLSFLMLKMPVGDAVQETAGK